MDTLVRDVRQALRQLSGHRGFAAAALATIALGVGGTAAVFSVVYGVMLRPLPYAEPDRLVRLWEEHPGGNAPIGGTVLSHPTWHAWRRSSRSLEGLAAFLVQEYTVTGAGAAERLRGARVTPGLFGLLRVSPVVGRFFDDQDADEGAAPVVVLTHAIWQERFGADPAALGRTIAIDDTPYRIIGVAPPGFGFPGTGGGWQDAPRDITLYTTFTPRPTAEDAKVIRVMPVVGRLANGATIAQAEAEGTAHARHVQRPLAELVYGKGRPVEVRVRSMVDQMTGEVQPALLVLAAAVGLVLLIACANVANLFLSRGSDRARELAVRAALGASRRQLVRQLLTESLVLSLIGGAFGLFIGWALTRAMPALAPVGFPRLGDIQVDAWFLGAAALAAIVVGIVSGVLPAWRSSRVDLGAAMHAGGARSVGTSGGRMRRVLLAVEAALAVVLLVGAALLARSLVALLQVDAGYDPSSVLTAELRVGGPDGSADRVALATLERLRAMPGVRAAGAGNMLPFGGLLSSSGFVLPGVTAADGTPVMAQALRGTVTPGYAEALGLRLKDGRFFREADAASAMLPLIVNEAFVKAYLTDGQPVVGRRFSGIFPRLLKRTDAVGEIVGVVGDVLPSVLDAAPQPQIYHVNGNPFPLGHAALVVRTQGDPVALAPLLRDIVRQIEPGAALERLSPLTTKVSASVSTPRFAAFVLAAFAALALALASTGLYGVLSYHVAQRRREIGVRAALGATRGDLVRMVLREGLGVTAVGVVAGMAAAALATRAMSGLLFGVTPLDTVAFAAGPIVLLAVAAVACLIPARRAAAVDPVRALAAD